MKISSIILDRPIEKNIEISIRNTIRDNNEPDLIIATIINVLNYDKLLFYFNKMSKLKYNILESDSEVEMSYNIESFYYKSSKYIGKMNQAQFFIYKKDVYYQDKISNKNYKIKLNDYHYSAIQKLKNPKIPLQKADDYFFEDYSSFLQNIYFLHNEILYCISFCYFPLSKKPNNIRRFNRDLSLKKIIFENSKIKPDVIALIGVTGEIKKIVDNKIQLLNALLFDFDKYQRRNILMKPFLKNGLYFDTDFIIRKEKKEIEYYFSISEKKDLNGENVYITNYSSLLDERVPIISSNISKKNNAQRNKIKINNKNDKGNNESFSSFLEENAENAELMDKDEDNLNILDKF